MSGVKFTPGPWEVCKRASTRVIDAADTTIASAGMASRILEEAQANARLIAAAPEMFDALKRCAELVRAACDLITENDLQDCEATWDETICDGQCYLDDAEAAMDNATSALAKAGRP